ncbi:MAG: hypothetical protein IJF74_06695 [Clostridia bacterium]|nr:hypothetical protein [Clostridia bacterium]
MSRNKLFYIVAMMTFLAILLTACGNIDNNDALTNDEGTSADPVRPTTEASTSNDASPEFINPVADEFTIELTGTDLQAKATWDPVPGAVYYLCKIYTLENNERVDVIEYTILSDWYGISVNYTQIPRGYGVEVFPLDENRNVIPTDKRLVSNVLSNPKYREPYRYPEDTPEVHPTYNIYWKDMLEFDLLSSIRKDSIITGDDGTVTFDAETYDGKVIRFFGKGVEFKNGNLVIYEEGRIWSLDALGRIISCDVHTVGELPSEHSINYYAMYSFTSKTSVDDVDQLYEGYQESNNSITAAIDYLRIDGYSTQGNFFSLGTIRAFDEDAATVEIDKIVVYYDTKTYTTQIKELDFNEDFERSYITGDLYDATKERLDLNNGIYDFYLMYRIDPLDAKKSAYSLPFVPFSTDSQFEIGALRNKDGKILDKEADALDVGSTIDITVGEHTLSAPLSVLPRVNYAKTQHELVPNAYPDAKGELNILVVPIVWQDTAAAVTAEVLAELYNALGRVIEKNGKVNDFSDGITANGHSLSEYYSTASYGQLRLTSFVTDRCHMPYNSTDNTFALSYDRAKEIIEKVYEMYPDTDFSSFDKDGNGYFDSVYFINVNGIGTLTRNFYTPKEAGTDKKLGINCYANISLDSLDSIGSKVLIHEFGHNLGLIDYYDVRQSGIDAVGSFDMQSQNAGDWNPYSKYSVGWITPKTVSDLKKGESVDIRIGAFANTGDAIVIPGAESSYNGTPFDEYIMIDLFTDRVLNQKDAEKYGLNGAVGVRIYHVNSAMEGRSLALDGSIIADGKTENSYPIGTVHRTNAYSENGTYHLELIQAGGNNTFTDLSDLRTFLQREDLFTAGDTFDAADYTEFFNDGKLDDGTELGYIIEIVSVTEGDEPEAVLRITRKN